MELREVDANGLRFAYLEEGSGPMALLLHGYPDDAYSWEHQLPALAAAGYRVVAPFCRGYPPSEVPAGGYFDRATLVMDVKALIEALGDGRPVDLVGQDWGAAIAYGVLGAFPELVRRAVILAIPHPVQIKRTLRRSPKHAIRSFHWFLFQLPWLPERLLRLQRGAMIELLWRLWSPAFDDRAHVARIRRKMQEPGVIEATLAYYRALVVPSRRDPALAQVSQALDRPIRVPTRVICGGRDMRRHLLEAQRPLFSGSYRWDVIEGAGHFLHRERPDAVNRAILEWFGETDAGGTREPQRERETTRHDVPR